MICFVFTKYHYTSDINSTIIYFVFIKLIYIYLYDFNFIQIVYLHHIIVKSLYFEFCRLFYQLSQVSDNMGGEGRHSMVY